MTFSLARVPYYTAVIAYMIMVGIIAIINSTITHGYDSDFHLLILLAAVGIGGVSVVYLWTAQSGSDDDATAEVAGVSISKKYYYIAVLVIAAYRAWAGYEQNHTHNGVRAFLGLAWVVASIALAVFTYANYKSYTAKHPTITVKPPVS